MALSLVCALAAAGVTTSAVNVRTGPSTSSTRIKKLEKGANVDVSQLLESGSTVTIAGKSYTLTQDWYKLTGSGYVAASYVQTSGSVAAAASDSDSTTDNSIINGTEVVVEDGLMEIVGGTVTNDDLAVVDDDLAEVGGNIVSGSVTMTATSNVNKCATPSTSGTKLSRVLTGEKVTVSAYIAEGDTYNGSKVKGNWYKIQSGGFVAAEYFSAEGHDPDDINIGDGVATTTSVNMREGPSTDTDKVKKLSFGSKSIVVNITTDNDGYKWALLKAGGYVRMDYLRYDALATLNADSWS